MEENSPTPDETPFLVFLQGKPKAVKMVSERNAWSVALFAAVFEATEDPKATLQKGVLYTCVDILSEWGHSRSY